MDEEDIDFGVPGSSRSRLSSLFQNDNSTGDVNQALTFTAPKQPKKNDNTQAAGGSLKLLYAVAVHAYKLKDGSYTNQGKLGCAVLGHHEAFIYKLLLYKGKQIQVNVLSITPNFIFHVQPNNYANFYDDKKENWSINFESEAALLDFTKQVALAKANSQGKSPTSLVSQDLVKGDGHSLENGDSAEVKYTGWLLSNFAFGQVFDSNMNSDSIFKIRLGKSKVIKGWHEGLLSMQKGGKRLLIIPADLAYGSEGMGSSVPPNSTLIFEIQVIKVKAARETSHSPSPVKPVENVTDKKPDVPPRQSFSHDDNIRMRGASISEQLTQSPKKDKAQLISRMAKMGTATLPFQGAIAAQISSDSESEVEPPQPPQPSSPAPQNVSGTSSPKAFAKTRSRTNSGQTVSTPPVQPSSVQASVPFNVSQPSSQLSLYAQSPMSSQQPFVCAATPFPTYQPTMPGQYPQSPYAIPNVPGMMPPVSTSMADSHLSLLVAETRTQSTEVRMSLSKITDKVDSVIQKVDDLRLQGKSATNSMPFMDGAIILQNIERIIQENTRLKEDVETKNSKIQSLNEKICDIFQRNQRFFEESNSMLEQKSGSMHTASAQSQEKILTLEQEKSKLQIDLSTTTIKLNTLEADLTKYQKLENELSQKLLDTEKEMKKQADSINIFKEQVNENQNHIHSLQEKLEASEQEKKVLNEKIKSMEEMLNSSQGSSELVEMYKKEIQEYKEKIEQMNCVMKANASSGKLEEENVRIKSQLAETTRLKDEVQSTVNEMRKEMDNYEKKCLSYQEKIKKLETEVEMAQVLKRKYEVFQEKTRALKEMYENQILELRNEIKHLQDAKSSAIPAEFSVEIKRVMNRLYKLLQGKFESDASYQGSKILETVLQGIMALTLQVLESKNQSSGDHSSSAETVEKDVISKQTHSESVSQTEFTQQNGIEEPQPESSSIADAAANAVGLVEKISITELGDAPSAEPPTEIKSEDISDLSVNKSVEEPSSQEQSTVQEDRPVRSESPEIWRPQPPPLFDDDDDDEDDDDWLK